MPEETKSKTPQIRFKGFEREWEEKALGEITTKIGSGKTPKGGDKSYVNSGVPLIRSQNIANDTVYLGKAVFIPQEIDEEMANSRVKTNDILLNITGASIGRSAVYRHEKPANVNQHVCIIRPLPKFSPDFIQLHLSSPNGQLKIDSNQAGGAREGLNFQQISWMGFDYPKFLEQTRIGGYFRELDGLIGQQQGKHDKLVTLKKAMLHAMFPQPGATTPAIRFQGFSGPWVEKKLGEIADRYDNLRVPVSASNRIPGNTPYYGANGIQDYVQGHTHEGEFILVAEDGANDLKNYPVQHVSGKIWVNNHAHVLGGKTGLAETRFLKYAFSQIDMEVFLVGGGRAKLNAETMMQIELSIPIVPAEQQKIGHYFRTLDELISRHALQLQKLKQLKSACLEKMFV